jgi:hypothetical protein
MQGVATWRKTDARMQGCKEGTECVKTIDPNQKRLEEKFHLDAMGLQLTGAAVTFGNTSSTPSSLVNVPRLLCMSSTEEGFLLYGFVFETPVDICLALSSPIRYTTVTVNTYALVSTQQSAQLLLSQVSQTVVNEVCGDPPPASSLNSITTLVMNGGGIVAGNCNNGDVTGANTPVVHFFQWVSLGKSSNLNIKHTVCKIEFVSIMAIP